MRGEPALARTFGMGNIRLEGLEFLKPGKAGGHADIKPALANFRKAAAVLSSNCQIRTTVQPYWRRSRFWRRSRARLPSIFFRHQAVRVLGIHARVGRPPVMPKLDAKADAIFRYDDRSRALRSYRTKTVAVFIRDYAIFV